MHVRDLLELSALIASHATAFLSDRVAIPQSSLESYWTASKARADRWGHGLKRYAVRVSPGATPRAREVIWLATRPILEEIFLSEVLTRVGGSFLVAYDRLRGLHDAGPIGRSVLVSHLEARHRAMHLLVHDPSIHAEHAVAMNRIRCRAERWTDLLVGGLMRVADVHEFAFNPARAREFESGLAPQGNFTSGQTGWQVVLASMRGIFAEGLDATAASPELNGTIANSVLSWWSAAPFDDTGLPRSAWLARISATSDDTERLIDQWIACDTNGDAWPSDLQFNVRPDKKPKRFGC